MSRHFIAIDWGTSNFRAFLVDAVSGECLESRRSDAGLKALSTDEFPHYCRAQIGDWRETAGGDQAVPVYLAGMVGSRNGWCEAAQLELPVGLDALEATREALTTGRIDAYWEYDSAVWIDVLGNEPDPDLDGGELLERLRDLDAERGIRWIGRSMFDDTYGFAMSPGTAAENAPTRYSVDAPDLARMVELVREDRDLELCVEPEFVERRDGLSLLEERTGAEVPDEQVRVLDDIDQIAPAVARGDCDFGEVFTTSGQIEALDLRLVQDRGVFAEYRLSLTIRDDALRQAPDALEQTVDRILSELPSSRIRELNGRVGQGEPVEAVATEFLDRFVE